MDWLLLGAMHLGILVGLWMGYEWGYTRGRKKGIEISRNAHKRAWEFVGEAIANRQDKEG